MESMDRDDGYDWVDDDSLDLDATMRRLEQLEPLRVVTTKQDLAVSMGMPATFAGVAVTITKSFFGPKQQVAIS